MTRGHESENLSGALLAWILAVTALAFGLTVGVYQLLIASAINLAG